mmetsp:Transcript_19407/g.47942  ORF Transcript_19407/g.47942 Transcript_19407/m.47942 type:complete len:96 (+) Transcript_19407:1516-1803(+)
MSKYGVSRCFCSRLDITGNADDGPPPPPPNGKKRLLLRAARPNRSSGDPIRLVICLLAVRKTMMAEERRQDYSQRMTPVIAIMFVTHFNDNDTIQ